MTMTLRRVGDVPIGRTFSDRFNLLVLGIKAVPADRNQTAVKKLRRLHPDFAFVTVRKGGVGERFTSDLLAWGCEFSLGTGTNGVRLKREKAGWLKWAARCGWVCGIPLREGIPSMAPTATRFPMFTESVAETLNYVLGVGYLVIAFGLMLAAPLGLLYLLLIGILRGYGPRFGLSLGITVAVWGSLCWVMVPYCGGYPNIPGMAFGAVTFGVGTWGQELSVHVTNLLLWPLCGWALFHLIRLNSPS